MANIPQEPSQQSASQNKPSIFSSISQSTKNITSKTTQASMAAIATGYMFGKEKLQGIGLFFWFIGLWVIQFFISGIYFNFSWSPARLLFELVMSIIIISVFVPSEKKGKTLIAALFTPILLQFILVTIGSRLSFPTEAVLFVSGCVLIGLIISLQDRFRFTAYDGAPLIIFILFLYLIPILRTGIGLESIGLDWLSGLLQNQTFLAMIPVWSIYVLFIQTKYEVETITALPLFIIALILISPLLLNNPAALEKMGFSPEALGILQEDSSGSSYGSKVYADFRSYVSESLSVSKKILTTSYNKTQTSIDKQIKCAQGYCPTVEDTQFDARLEGSAKVKIEIKDVQTTTPIDQDQPAVVVGTLYVDSNQPIDIYPYCYAVSSKKVVITGIALTSPLKRIKTQTIPLSCHFAPGSFIGGSYQLYIGANYTFESIGQLSRYFTAQEKFPSADVFYQLYQIPKNQITKYSAGPIRVGIDFGDTLNIIPQQPTQTTVGISLDTLKTSQSTLKELSTVYIGIPKPLQIATDGSSISCYVGGSNATFSLIDEQLADDQYLYTQDEQETQTKQTLTTPIDIQSHSIVQATFYELPKTANINMLCTVQVPSNTQLPGKLPYSELRFRVYASYIASISSQVSLKVNAVENPPFTQPYLLNREFCTQQNAYSFVPVASYLFSFNPNQRDVYTAIRTQLQQDSSWSTIYSSSSTCSHKNLLLGLIAYKWPSVRLNPKTGTYIGYAQLTTQMLESIEPDKTQLTSEYIFENNRELALEYISYLDGLCSSDISCIVGKYYCGESFVMDDINSCATTTECSACMQTHIPAIVTLASEIEQYHAQS
jgi:hypothetical protein